MKIIPKHILIVRADHVGDLLFSLPMVTYLKQLFPGVRITLLALNYVRGMADIAPNIDNFIGVEDTEYLSNPEKAKKILLDQKADVCIDITYNARRKKRAIRYYLSKFVQEAIRGQVKLYIKRKYIHALDLYPIYLKNIFLKNKYFSFLFEKEYRELSVHEIYRNLIILKSLGIKTLPRKEEIASLYQLDTSNIILEPAIEALLSKDKFNLILHPKSSGNCIEWPLDNYVYLIEKLDLKKIKVFITGSKQEVPYIEYILSKLKDKEAAINLGGKFSSPSELSAFINKADGLIAGSTGPMHISAALGKKTIGIFPYSKNTKHFKKWNHQHTNPANTYYIVNKDVNKITPDAVLNIIIQHF